MMQWLGNPVHNPNYVTSFAYVHTGVPVVIRGYRGLGGNGHGVAELSPHHQARYGRNLLLGQGVYFTDSKTEAAKYGTVKEVEVSLSKPYVIRGGVGQDDLGKLNVDRLQAEGYDGVIVDTNSFYPFTHESYRQGVIFDPKRSLAFTDAPRDVLPFEKGTKVVVINEPLNRGGTTETWLGSGVYWPKVGSTGVVTSVFSRYHDGRPENVTVKIKGDNHKPYMYKVGDLELQGSRMGNPVHPIPNPTLLLYRIGDWYEALGVEPSIVMRDVLGVRPVKGGPQGYHAGIPYHDLGQAVRRLEEAGYSVEVIEEGGKHRNPRARRFAETAWFDPVDYSAADGEEDTRYHRVPGDVPPPGPDSRKGPSPSTYLYHLTTIRSLRSLASTGLTPRDAAKGSSRGSFQERKRFYADNYGVTIPRKALYAASHAGVLGEVDRDYHGPGKWALLRFRAGYRSWHRDPEYSRDDPGAWFTRSPIPPDELEVLVGSGSAERWAPLGDIIP